MQKTFYQKWEDNEPGFTNHGSFTTQLMLLYRIADNGNRAKLEKAFPEYFVKTVNENFPKYLKQ
jgi:hypothetical protein